MDVVMTLTVPQNSAITASRMERCMAIDLSIKS
jgi:hypothetical protein